MRIGIDCRTILNPEKDDLVGITHYTYQLVKHLISLENKSRAFLQGIKSCEKDLYNIHSSSQQTVGYSEKMLDKEKNEYVLFFDKEIAEKNITKFSKPWVKIKYFPFSQYKKFLPIAYSHFLTSAFLKRENLNIWHSPTPNLPLSYNEPSIVTVHDLSIYKFPKLFPPGQFLNVKVITPNALKRAKKIIAVSQSIKQDLIKIFKTPANKIEVIYNGINKELFSELPKLEIEKIKNQYKIKENYILFLGTLEPRKNIKTLIEAFELFQKNSAIKYQLVIAGKEGWEAKKIYQKALRSPYKNEIIFTGYISPENLNGLFSEAKTFVFPSFHEGFGTPVIEAMAKKIPVITSNIESLPEITAGSTILINPHKKQEINEALELILNNVNLRTKLIEKGFKRAKEFSWEKCAKETLKVYKNI
ncbi:glycosyltransferase family 4 protein [Candidatus Kuenenbacteria bacterium]|nr:glycosyltransferase family 4 protein [Candidatus Kuenenbacteria bacterium]